MKLLVSTRGPCWAVAGQDRHFASQPHGVELNHPCGLTVDGTSPSASMCPSPSRVRLRQRTAPSRSEDALIRGGHPGTRCMTRLTVTGNECRRRVVRMTYEACTYRVHESTSRRLVDVPLPLSLLIIAALSLCFANSYNGEFVFDDSEAIVHNEDVQTTPLMDVFKNDFWGSKERNTAFYATALFAVHPVHTEAVSSIVGRAELLCALFIWFTERTLYIPSAGYCLLFITGLQKLCNRVRVQYLLLAYVALISLFFMKSWMRSDQWRTETTLFRSALDVCPLNAKVHYNIAKNAADAGNFMLAQYEYEEALRLNPTYAQAMNNLGNLLKNQGKYLEAETLFKRAIELQEDFATAWMNLGIVLSTLKRYEESEKSYLTALSHRSKYPDCFYNLGVLYLEQKDYNKALIAWESATRQRSTHRRAWTNMILLLDDLGTREDALKIANQALQYLPDDASIHFNIANILGKIGNFVEAEIYFKNAIAKNPKDAMFYTNLGVLYHRWNKFQEAENMYKKALEVKPELNSAKENLRKLYSLRSPIK
ncbi:Transmembrane and TPR repeat-containing protein 4 [Eufriesea mexicana]|nr:Transmembrane and TPR repeat-containing protein 4 [Eufriesea mexicana]